jgi:hypothetical protein
MHIVVCRSCGEVDDIKSMIMVGEAKGFVKGFTCDCEGRCGGERIGICYYELYCGDCAKVNGYDGNTPEDYSDDDCGDADEDWDDYESDTLYCSECAECIFIVDAVAGRCKSCANVSRETIEY